MNAKASIFLLALLAATGLATRGASGQPVDAAKQRDIEELLRVLRWDAGPDVLPKLFAAYRKVYPQVPESEWREVELAAEELEDPRERLVSLYDRLYTADEIRQILAFHHSPLGQKLLATSTLTMTEGVLGKQEYVVQAGTRMESVLHARGYERREPDLVPAAPRPGTLTLGDDGWVRRPKVVQPER